jgi:Tfp pilus assembly protein PilX
VTPDLALVPEKYHPFIQPAVRRVYLDTAEARADRERLQARIAALERDKAQVMHRAESAMRRADVCADGERQARVALEKKKAELARAAAENDRIRKRLEDAEE